MVHFMKRFLHKHNSLLATALSLVLLISGSLQLVHDQLIDHAHNADCAMYVLDGSSAIGSQQTVCLASQQLVEATPLHPVKLVLSQVDQHPARAPPSITHF